MLTEWQLGLSSDAMDLLQRMLFLDPKDRLSLGKLHTQLPVAYTVLPCTAHYSFCSCTGLIQSLHAHHTVLKLKNEISFTDQVRAHPWMNGRRTRPSGLVR